MAEDGNTVWLDLSERNASRRFKAAQVLHPPEAAHATVGNGERKGDPTEEVGGAAASASVSLPMFANGTYRLLSSADGIHWNLELCNTGIIGDRYRCGACAVCAGVYILALLKGTKSHADVNTSYIHTVQHPCSTTTIQYSWQL